MDQGFTNELRAFEAGGNYRMKGLLWIPLLLGVLILSGCTSPDGFPVLAYLGSIQGPPPKEDPKLGLSMDEPFSFCASPFEYQNIDGERATIVKRFGVAPDSILTRKTVGDPGFHHYSIVTFTLKGEVRTVYFQEWSGPSTASR
jgi:hypothetical protein